MLLTSLSTKALLESMTELLGDERRTLARLLAHLIEVEDRRAHLEAACSSLFEFLIRKLGLSEGEAFRRINAARLARRYPVVLQLIESGRIYLSALVLLRDHLTDENHAELLAEAAGQSKAGVQRLLATRFPRPDVETSVCKLPQRAMANDAPRASVEPLSADRYRVQFTATEELRAKLERASGLLSHCADANDLAAVIERALDVLIVDLEKRKLGATPRPRAPRKAKASHVTNAVRREVVARDGEQCSFVSEDGERCSSRTRLELDHRNPRARGGTSEAANLRWLCRAHNAYEAERAFGKEHVAERIRFSRRKQRPNEAATAAETAAPGAMIFERAEKALMTMGFRSGEAARAILDVRPRHETGDTPLVEEVLRDALRLLARDGCR